MSRTFSSSLPACQTSSTNSLLGCGSWFPGHLVSIACMTPDCEGEAKKAIQRLHPPQKVLAGARRTKSEPVVGQSVGSCGLDRVFIMFSFLRSGTVEADSDATRYGTSRSIELLFKAERFISLTRQVLEIRVNFVLD